MSRLVVVSNRLPPISSHRATAGGLAIGLQAALQQQGGIWFGWSGKTGESSPRRPTLTQIDNVCYASIDLTRKEREEYYNGFANRTLWPLFHNRIDLTAFERRFYDTFNQVNIAFAEGLASLLKRNSIVWVHDYHLIACGQELRRLGAKQPIGFFLHIPFPASDMLVTLPDHKPLVQALFAYDLIGFQTERDLRSFAEYVVMEAGGRVEADGRITAFGRTVRTGAFPIGIDTENFVELARSAEAQRNCARMRESLNQRQLIIGVDRLDYTKGIRERLEAFARLLEIYPENRGNVSFLQIAPPSRADLQEYRRITTELEQVAGHINGAFAEFDWVPIRYMNQSFSRRALAGLYRAARIGLVTPLRDGMNLVAKEFVAAQDPENPGVLVLSAFAGAARELRRALVVNPYDRQEVAEAIQTGLQMSRSERQRRWEDMMQVLSRNDIDTWCDAFLERLMI